MTTAELTVPPSASLRLSGSRVVAPDVDRTILVDAERQPCEVWTRVMGYHRPVSSFNAGKQSEHAERRFFRA